MRPCFSDLQNLKKIARESVEKGIAKLKNWWVDKYKLPPNHQLFMNRSIASLNMEMYEDLYLKKEDIESEMENASGREYSVLSKRLNAINTALEGEEYEDDPLIAKWERELLEGKIPDLEERG